MAHSEAKRRQRAWVLTGIAVGMLGFAFLNIPLFRVFCSHIGLSTPTNQKVAIEPVSPQSRKVDVSFTGIAAAGLMVTLQPQDPLETVHVGARAENHYTFTNLTGHPIRFRAIHDIYPGDAAEHIAMIQCFCFTDQTLQPHETKTLPVIYQINSGLSSEVSRASIIYTLEPLAPAQ